MEQNRGFTKRMLITIMMALLIVPITIFLGMYAFDDRKYYFISTLIVIESFLPLIILFEGRKSRAREYVLISVLSAIAVVGRAAFFMLPQFKPFAAFVIISGAALGPEAGFLVGCMGMLVSNFMFGQGPWTPWQMFAYGMIGLLAGLLFEGKKIKTDALTLSIYGFLSVLIVFGGIMNPASLLMYTSRITKNSLIAAYAAGFPMDLIQAVSTVIFLCLAAKPMLTKIERVKVKYGLFQ